MQDIFHSLQAEIEKNGQAMLVAIVEFIGSVPQRTGAYMAVGKQGRICGTIGGGEMEYESTQLAVECLSKGIGMLHEFDLTPTSKTGVGMICGGIERVLFYRCTAEDTAWIEDGLKAEKEGKPYWLILPLNGKNAAVRAEMPLEESRTLFIENGETCYAERMNYDGTVYIFGAGHIARELVHILSRCDFRCVVADDRAEYLNPADLEGVFATKLLDLAHPENTFSIAEKDYIVIMTREHKQDAEVERYALTTPAHYIGMLGSRKKAAYIHQKFKAEGFSEETLSRVTTPIGLSIGSQKPAEIAVSIAAQLIAVRSSRYKKA